MIFQKTFDVWMERSLSITIPDGVIAYSFNLAEPWSIEVVGCGSYDADDPDWACDEVFRPDEPALSVHSEHFGPDWETVQQRSVELIRSFLDSDPPASLRLRSSNAIAPGFVDGDWELLLPQHL